MLCSWRNLQDARQSGIRADCLKLWKVCDSQLGFTDSSWSLQVPNKPRAEAPAPDALEIFTNVWEVKYNVTMITSKF